jgi:hypothetical protein
MRIFSALQILYEDNFQKLPPDLILIKFLFFRSQKDSGGFHLPEATFDEIFFFNIVDVHIFYTDRITVDVFKVCDKICKVAGLSFLFQLHS